MMSIHFKGEHSEATAALIETTIADVAAALGMTTEQTMSLVSGLVDRLTEEVEKAVSFSFKLTKEGLIAEIEGKKKSLFHRWQGEARANIDAVWAKHSELVSLAIALHRQDLINRQVVATALAA